MVPEKAALKEGKMKVEYFEDQQCAHSAKGLPEKGIELGEQSRLCCRMETRGFNEAWNRWSHHPHEARSWGEAVHPLYPNMGRLQVKKEGETFLFCLTGGSEWYTQFTLLGQGVEPFMELRRAQEEAQNRANWDGEQRTLHALIENGAWKFFLTTTDDTEREARWEGTWGLTWRYDPRPLDEWEKEERPEFTLPVSPEWGFRP
jgi:hypothetical protein